MMFSRNNQISMELTARGYKRPNYRWARAKGPSLPRQAKRRRIRSFIRFPARFTGLEPLARWFEPRAAELR